MRKSVQHAFLYLGAALLTCSLALSVAVASGAKMPQEFAQLRGGDLRECDIGDDSCTEWMRENLGGGYLYCSGGQIVSACGQPPCQVGSTETHNCFYSPCDGKTVKICYWTPIEACTESAQDCGEAEPGECTSTKVCTACPNPPYGPTDRTCTCTFGTCTQKAGGSPVPCTPVGCGLDP